MRDLVVIRGVRLVRFVKIPGISGDANALDLGSIIDSVSSNTGQVVAVALVPHAAD